MIECILQEFEFLQNVLKEEGMPNLKKIQAIQKRSWNNDIYLGGWYNRGLLIPTTNIYISFEFWHMRILHWLRFS